MTVCSRIAAAALAAMALLLAACGGGTDSKTNGATAQLKGPSADKIASQFGRVSGAALVKEGGETPDWTLLSLPKGTDRYEQYGVFSLYVVKTERGRKILLSDNGKPRQQEGNLYWSQADSGGYSVAQQIGGNVIVIWQAGEQRQLDDRFRGLVSAVQAAVDGKASNVAPEEQQCQQAGIDPDKGPKEGTCRLEAMKLTVVNGSSRLQTPVLAAQIKNVSTTDQIQPDSQYLDPKQARGRFVVIEYQLENTGDRPLDYMREKLILDGKTYEADGSVSFDLNPKDPMPVQPGMSSTVKTAFDVPPDVADRFKEAVFALPAARFDESSNSLDDEAAQGRIRLADAPQGGISPSDQGADNDDDLQAGSGGGSSSQPSNPGLQRRLARQKTAVRAVKQFFTAVRHRDAAAVCNRLTEGTLKRFGGLASCKSGTFVKSSFAQKLPTSNRGLRFTAGISGSRATVFVVGKRWSGLVALVKQGDTWRVNRMNGGKRRGGSSSGSRS
jgi:Domain of unknown function (DUF4352)